MRIVRPIVLTLACCLSAGALAVQPKPELPELQAATTLGVVDVESDGKLSAVNIRFEAKPSWTEPQVLEDHGTFLQIQLPNTIVPEPGKFFDGAGPIVKKIAVFQLTPTTAGVRMFVDKDAARVRQAAAAELLDKRVVVTIDHDKLDTLNAAAAGTEIPTALQKPELSAEQVIAQVKVDHGIDAPAGAIKGQGTPAFKIGGLDLRSKLIQVALFSGAMLLLMGFAFMMKPFMKRRRAKIGGEAVIDMRMLASLALAPRQKLSVIQVGDEKILIGITPENVSFISVIGARPAVAMASPSSLPRSFSGLLTTSREEAPGAAPKLKDIPGNDVESLRADAPIAAAPMVAPIKKTRPDVSAPKPAARPPAATAPIKRTTGRLNIAVGDDGVRRLDDLAPAKAIDDVTRMIREKLRNIGTNS